MRYILALFIICGCSPRTIPPSQRINLSDTLSTSIEPMSDLKADRTEEVKGYWKHNGTDSIFVQPYKRKPRGE